MMVQIPPELHGQKILITGGAGAIGSRMVKALMPVADILVVDGDVEMENIAELRTEYCRDVADVPADACQDITVPQ